VRLFCRREELTDVATVGSLFVNGSPDRICYVLEDPVRERDAPVSEWKIPKNTAIPRGAYRVIINESQRFQRRLPLLLDVPGFDGIRVHAGNSAVDTEGCPLVGMTHPIANWVAHSLDALNQRVYPLIETALLGGVEVWWEVR
jgi:hypothetical protein